MNLHEYQAKNLLSKYGVQVLPGYLAYTPREAQKAAEKLLELDPTLSLEKHQGIKVRFAQLMEGRQLEL